MSEHSDDGFDRYLAAQEREFYLQQACPRDEGDPDKPKRCHWAPNDDGLMECKTCGEVIDL